MRKWFFLLFWTGTYYDIAIGDLGARLLSATLPRMRNGKPNRANAKRRNVKFCFSLRPHQCLLTFSVGCLAAIGNGFGLSGQPNLASNGLKKIRKLASDILIVGAFGSSYF